MPATETNAGCLTWKNAFLKTIGLLGCGEGTKQMGAEGADLKNIHYRS